MKRSLEFAANAGNIAIERLHHSEDGRRHVPVYPPNEATARLKPDALGEAFARPNPHHAMATWDQVRRYALALPGVTEKTSHGSAAWIVDKKLFVWERPLRKSDLAALGDAAPKGAILGVRTADLEMKEAIIASDPRVFFTIPHFDGYPAVLVLLDKIRAKDLQRIVTEAWIARAPERSVREHLAHKR